MSDLQKPLQPHRRSFMDRFSLARLAYRRRDVELAQAAHTDERLERTLREIGARGRLLADAVLGATDGIVTTFAVVAGAAGAYLSPRVVLIMGFANLFADGFSMSVGNYLGASSQREYGLHERKREIWEIENLPQAERKEIQRLYRRKGFEEPLLEQIVDTVTGDKERWADEMMREELGIQEESVAPLASGLVTFGAFFLAGLLPLLPYVAGLASSRLMAGAFPISVGMTVVSLFGVGVARRFMTRRSWWWSGLEILGMGGLAAAGAFAVGHFLQGSLG